MVWYVFYSSPVYYESLTLISPDAENQDVDESRKKTSKRLGSRTRGMSGMVSKMHRTRRQTPNTRKLKFPKQSWTKSVGRSMKRCLMMVVRWPIFPKRLKVRKDMFRTLEGANERLQKVLQTRYIIRRIQNRLLINVIGHWKENALCFHETRSAQCLALLEDVPDLHGNHHGQQTSNWRKASHLVQ